MPTSSLQHEYSVLTQLQGGAGLPRPLWLGREGSYRVMVLENLGPSLDELVHASSLGAFELNYVAQLGLQLVSEIFGTMRVIDLA